MKNWTRLLSLLLVLAMMLGMMPVTARAEETNKLRDPGSYRGTIQGGNKKTMPGSGLNTAPVVSEDGNSATIPFQVNPLYSGIYSAEDFDVPAAKPRPQEATTNATNYVSVEKAGQQIRDYMEDRTEVFTVYYHTDTFDFQASADEVVAEAMKHTGDPEEGDYINWQYGGWNADMWRYSSDNGGYDFEAIFYVSYYTTAAQEAEMDVAVANLLKSLNLKNKTDYEKIYAVYDWICRHITYDYENLEDTSYMRKHTAYAALIDRTAVCQGYAVLFYRLMLELGIDARLIAGDGGGPHGWNIVELDGLYYNVDSTWDAGTNYYTWFLLNTWDFTSHERYMEYDTIAFHNEYPMAAESYYEGVHAIMDPYVYGGIYGTEEYDFENAWWLLGRDGTLTFRGEGDLYDMPYDGQPWFYYWADEITKIVVEEGITSTGSYNFWDLYAVKEADVASTVKNLGFQCFGACEAMEKVILRNGLESMDNYAFSYCYALKNIEIPATVTYIGEECFCDCAALENIYFLGDAPYIDSYAFENVYATAYYPKGNSTWTSDVMQDYGGNITWRSEVTLGVPEISGRRNSNNKAVITWDAVDGAAKYEVWRSTKKNGTYKKLITTTKLSCTNSPTPGTYWYKVRAIGANGKEGEFSNIVGIIVRDTVPKITGKLSNNKAVISWKAVHKATKYEVYRATSENGTYKKLITTSKLTCTNTPAAGTYYYKVRAVLSDGTKTKFSNIVKVTVYDTVPKITGKLSNNKAVITWGPVKDAVKYEVYRSTSENGTYKRLITTSKLTCTNTPAAGTYYYKVRAIKEDGTKTKFSNIVKVTVLDKVPVITGKLSNNKAVISWKAVHNAEKYEVWRATSENGTYKRLITTTKLSCTNSPAAGTYYYKVRAILKDGTKTKFSNVVKMAVK